MGKGRRYALITLSHPSLSPLIPPCPHLADARSCRLFPSLPSPPSCFLPSPMFPLTRLPSLLPPPGLCQEYIGMATVLGTFLFAPLVYALTQLAFLVMNHYDQLMQQVRCTAMHSFCFWPQAVAQGIRPAFSVLHQQPAGALCACVRACRGHGTAKGLLAAVHSGVELGSASAPISCCTTAWLGLCWADALTSRRPATIAWPVTPVSQTPSLLSPSLHLPSLALSDPLYLRLCCLSYPSPCPSSLLVSALSFPPSLPATLPPCHPPSLPPG